MARQCWPTFGINYISHRKYIHSRELKKLHQKFEVEGFHNKFMMLILYLSITISNGFHLSFLYLIILYVWFVTSHVTSFYNEATANRAQF